MTEPVHACESHGYYGGAACPDCGTRGPRVLDPDRRRRLSKFLSGALRHFPAEVGLDPDGAGWVDRERLVGAAERTYDWGDADGVDAVIATDPKGRFERSGNEIRAAYGHSVEVDLSTGDDPVSDTLFHGTAPANLDSIREEGLRPMDRQEVHLSGTVEVAREVGARPADEPAVLPVHAGAMIADGHEVAKRGRGVYTAPRVPPEYLGDPESPDGE